jgi:1-acyl-sn-glycerol-3-phosphate acyltransferase
VPPAAELANPERGLRASVKGLASFVRAAIGFAPPGAHVDAWGKDAALVRSLRPLADTLYSRYFRVHVDGASLIPHGPCVIVANHAGALPLDGPVLHHAIRQERPDLPEARWLLEDQVMHAPIVGVIANRLGAVRASPENALALLAEGRPIIVFPEGFHGLSKPFSERYQLRRFGRGGAVKIAVKARVPIVPAAVIGGEESMPLLARLPGKALGVDYVPLTPPPLPARWSIQFGAPLDFADAPKDAQDDLAWVQRTNEQVRETIRGMLDSLLAARKTVYR